jgi:hypothetical protein
MCDAPSESIEYFPGTAFKFFFKLLVTIPVAPIITGIIIIIIIILGISFMQGIYTYIPETNLVPREQRVAAILM